MSHLPVAIAHGLYRLIGLSGGKMSCTVPGSIRSGRQGKTETGCPAFHPAENFQTTPVGFSYGPGNRQPQTRALRPAGIIRAEEAVEYPPDNSGINKTFIFDAELHAAVFLFTEQTHRAARLAVPDGIVNKVPYRPFQKHLIG